MGALHSSFALLCLIFFPCKAGLECFQWWNKIKTYLFVSSDMSSKLLQRCFLGLTIIVQPLTDRLPCYHVCYFLLTLDHNVSVGERYFQQLFVKLWYFEKSVKQTDNKYIKKIHNDITRKLSKNRYIWENSFKKN